VDDLYQGKTPITEFLGKWSDRLGGWGLRNKILAPTILITLLTGLVLNFQSSSRIQKVLHGELQSKGTALCHALAANAQQSMATQDISTIQSHIDEYRQTAGVAYVYVTDAQNKVLVHTFSPSFPEGLQEVNKPAPGTSDSQVKTVDYMNIDALDIATPILAGIMGTAHIGMDLNLEKAQVRANAWISFWTVALILLLGIAALWAVTQRIINPILALSVATEKIVKEGDLSQKIVVVSQDEVGRLAGNFSLMVEKLREIPLGLQGSVQKLSQALSGLQKAAEEQNKSVTAQAAALQETQVTAQEIKQTSQMAAQKASEILQLAEKADEIGHTGEASVEQSLKGLTDIRHQVLEISGKIGDLTDRTRQIGGITDTVKDLADQSNMLALNAAIEAVRSGEHGKGFGLVAREIRRLADQSLQSTGRVKEILDNISEAIDKLAQITESGSRRMEDGLVQVKSSGENLRALVGVIKDNSASVKQIANAVNQQNIGISQVFTAVKDQNTMMEETVKRLESTMEAVKALQEVAKSVSDIVGSYKV